MYSILIVDDDKDLSFITSEMLSAYNYRIDTVESAVEAFFVLKNKQYHLIILDINLPDESGFEICKELRKVSCVPVIFISARTSENDKVNGLDIGGDDYIEKPFSMKELLSRVNALIRRSYGSQEKITKYSINNNITVNLETRSVIKDSTEVKLALKEFDLLIYMCRNENKVISKEELLKEVWGIFSEAEISTVSVHIRWLREKLESDPSKPEIIKTVWGVGYQLVQNGENI